MMCLWEATNGWCGEAYVRCYVWAESESAARELAAKAFQDEWQGSNRDKRYAHVTGLTKLFSSAEPAFATAVSDEGWERP